MALCFPEPGCRFAAGTRRQGGRDGSVLGTQCPPEAGAVVLGSLPCQVGGGLRAGFVQLFKSWPYHFFLLNPLNLCFFSSGMEI